MLVPPAGARLRRGRGRARAASTGSPRACATASAPARVFDTLLDETSILGLGLGAGLGGLLPIPEIQYLAYLHNAEDQLRGEAATMQFFSVGAVPQPDGACASPGSATSRASAATSTTTTRSPCCATSPGSWSRCPPAPTTPAAMLRTCLAAAEVDGSGHASSWSRSRSTTPVTCYEDGDGRLARARTTRPAEWADTHVPIGRARVYSLRPGRPAHHHHLRQRGADVAAGRRPAGRGGHRLPRRRPALARRRCRSPTSSASRPPPAGCWSSTRPAAPAASARA